MKNNFENTQQIEQKQTMKDLESIKLTIPEDRLIEASDIICDFADELRKKYKNTTDYMLYHLLIGSTVRQQVLFDFPGDDSVEKFIREQLSKFTK